MSDKEQLRLDPSAAAWTATPPPANGKTEEAGEIWERDLVKRLLLTTLEEQRRARRWGVFFKILLFAYLFVVLWGFLQATAPLSGIGSLRHTALVDVRGVIADDSDANADFIIAGLQAAFEDQGTAGVILRINSPGGSPVQAGHVNDEIARLRKQHPDIPVYAVITDMCASGGYYIAAATDKIYADKASVVGSIGVVMDGFGFVEAMGKLGVERRLLTAGDHKGFLDPFSPVKDGERRHVQGLLDGIHQQFIDVVKRGRGARLQGDDKTLFSGLVWTGEQALALGLVDGLGSPGYVAREVIGEAQIVDYTQGPGLLETVAKMVGVSLAKAFSATVGAPPGLGRLR